MNRRHTLKKNEEIKKLVEGRKRVGNKFFVIYYEDSPVSKAAVSVPGKMGKAVFRNHQKRIIREILRKNRKKTERKKILVVAKEKSTELCYTEKEKELLGLLEKTR